MVSADLTGKHLIIQNKLKRGKLSFSQLRAAFFCSDNAPYIQFTGAYQLTFRRWLVMFRRVWFFNLAIYGAL